MDKGAILVTGASRGIGRATAERLTGQDLYARAGLSVGGVTP